MSIFSSKNNQSVDELVDQSRANYIKAVASLRDIIAPSGVVVNTTSLKLGGTYVRTLFILTYPRYLSPGWFSSVINFEDATNISIFYHPIDNSSILRKLRKKLGDVGAQIQLEAEKGSPRNPALETAVEDIESLRESIVQGTEKMFRVAVYITLIANSEKELNDNENKINTFLESKMIYPKPAHFRHFEGYECTVPVCLDRLGYGTLLNSTPSSTLFPFISANLTQNTGIMYGINLINNSLVIFDRFTRENANMCVFGTSGSGKSYAVKTHAVRELMMGSDIIVIDPENEYEYLAKAVGGESYKIAVASKDHINPFDLPIIASDETVGEVFRGHVLNLIGLIKILLGGLTPMEEVIIDQAITLTYASRNIDPEGENEIENMPILEDLVNVLNTMEGGENLSAKLYKYTKGTYGKFLNNSTNIDIRNRFVVFNINDLEEELRPIAMYILLNYVWNNVKKVMKKRILIVEEAWLLMKFKESANFLLSFAKRARKYYLGLTTITQDLDDFLKSPHGIPIITNSSIKLLFKQSTVTIRQITEALQLTEVENNILTQIDIGSGLFLAGDKHALIQVVASYTEDQLITSDPQKLMALRNKK
jgi:conjugal transfer ATP-binding protein TraC